ncbi:hypothetical protein [Streptomyces litchfieldiae]|uniref:Uncharacterized protein n=1 Tax=Streptomyces litchfieldiae TaxID=3075543 RepID=A0ABU2N214_9ACTN|nr:hypothetical protein [Streptomyces sp. DSM 44938]MDT0347652.1 hypothetical protein [Streptomyces sp. DSM 44938]
MTRRLRLKRVLQNIPPGRRELAEALRRLCRHLKAATQAEILRLLAERGYTKTKSELSRYLSGERLPPAHFVRALHGAAVDISGAHAVGCSEADLLDLHSKAEALKCAGCAVLRAENATLRAENGSLREDLEYARKARGGLPPGNVARRGLGSHLPVPRPRADRQDMETRLPGKTGFQVSSQTVMAFVADTEQLHREGRHRELAALCQEGLQGLMPTETAHAVAVLRAHGRSFVDDLIQMAGRDQSSADVMATALELIKQKRAGDAGQILEAALA